MTMRLGTAWVGVMLSGLWLLGGCAADGDGAGDVGDVGAALEADNGGLTMEDDAPGLGLDPELAELGLLEEDLPSVDPMLDTAEVRTVSAAADARVYHVAVEGGRIPASLDPGTARNWSGLFGVNRGAVIVDRAMRFEPVTDRLLPRTDPRAVPFTSVTLPHHDGLILRVIDPTPGASEALHLYYVGAGGARVDVEVASLVGRPRELVSDAAGNRMIAIAGERTIDGCARGFLAGRWQRLGARGGLFFGRVVGPMGGLEGHVRGIWGVRRSGEQVFFGKYVGPDGTFRGLLAGHYADGRFEGRWIDRAGDRGALGGAYGDGPIADNGRGAFLGAFAETSCSAR